MGFFGFFLIWGRMQRGQDFPELARRGPAWVYGELSLEDREAAAGGGAGGSHTAPHRKEGWGNGGPLMAKWQLEWARVHLLRVTHQKPLAVSLSP